jgi:hypothetical protein
MKGPPFWWEAGAGIYIAGSSMCCTGGLSTTHEEADDSGETDTSRGALAARYGDIVKRRVVSLDVEYRFESGWLDSGGVNWAASQHSGGRAV